MRIYLFAALSIGIAIIIGGRVLPMPERLDALGPAVSAPAPVTIVEKEHAPVVEATAEVESTAPTVGPVTADVPVVATSADVTPTEVVEAPTVESPNTETSLGVGEEARQAMILELKNWDLAQFPAVSDVTYVGTGKDGFDNYFYQSEEAQILQWKKGDDLFVEQIEFPNGNRIVRRSDLDQSLKPSVSFDRPDGTGGSIYFNSRREVESFTHRERDRSTAYFYDEDGNLKSTFTFK